MLAWDPKETRLALCAGTNKIYMWSPAGCLDVEVPCEGNHEFIFLTACPLCQELSGN